MIFRPGMWRAKFEIEYGTSIEEFLDSVYLAGAD